MDLQKVKKNMENKGYVVRLFETKEAAADYLVGSYPKYHSRHGKQHDA
jgi:hypothetical protein